MLISEGTTRPFQGGFWRQPQFTCADLSAVQQRMERLNVTVSPLGAGKAGKAAAHFKSSSIWQRSLLLHGHASTQSLLCHVAQPCCVPPSGHSCGASQTLRMRWTQETGSEKHQLGFGKAVLCRSNSWSTGKCHQCCALLEEPPALHEVMALLKLCELVFKAPQFLV